MMPEDPEMMDNLDDTQSQDSAVLDHVQWQEHIPEEYRGKGYWEPLKDKSLSDVLKTYGEAQSLIGSSVRLPQDDSPEAWGKVWNRLGRPDNAEQYQATIGNLEGVEWDSSRINDFRSVAHQAGLTNKQVQTMFDWYGNEVQAQMNHAETTASQQKKETESALKDEWGLNFERNRNLARRGAMHIFGEEGFPEAERAFGNSIPLMQGLSKIGRSLMEDGLIGESSAEFGGMSRSEAKQEIEKLTAPDSPYWTKPGQKPDPRSQDIRDKVTELFKIAHPDDKG